jgi:hypothetical protein
MKLWFTRVWATNNARLKRSNAWLYLGRRVSAESSRFPNLRSYETTHVLTLYAKESDYRIDRCAIASIALTQSADHIADRQDTEGACRRGVRNGVPLLILAGFKKGVDDHRSPCHIWDWLLAL